MTWRDTLKLQVFCGITGKFENFGSEVLQDSGEVYGSLGTDARLLASEIAKMALYATAWELKVEMLIPRHILQIALLLWRRRVALVQRMLCATRAHRDLLSTADAPRA